jgi:ribosomal protein S18 acetylase RimI-like enzyme
MDNIGDTGAHNLSTEITRRARDYGEVVRLLPQQREQAAAVATKAFLDDIVYSYIFTDVEERERCLRRYLSAFFGFARHYGETYTLPGVEGVACWLSPWKTKPVLWQVIRTSFALPRVTLSFQKESRNRMVALASVQNQVHSRAIRGRHWQLAVLVVDPMHQHQGIGSQLIQPVLRQADAEGLPCYLDTDTESNVRFYEHFGFTVVSEGEVSGHPIKIWAMVRPPER